MEGLLSTGPTPSSLYSTEKRVDHLVLQPYSIPSFQGPRIIRQESSVDGYSLASRRFWWNWWIQVWINWWIKLVDKSAISGGRARPASQGGEGRLDSPRLLQGGQLYKLVVGLATPLSPDNYISQ